MADSDHPLRTEIVDQNIDALVDIEQDAENANEEIADQDATMTDSTAVELDDELGIIEQGAENGNEKDNGDSKDMSGSLLGMTGATLDEMYEMYCRHAQANGFSVRKATTRLSTTGIELAKLFVCSCAGLKSSKTGSTRTRKSRKERNVGFTRTNCKALLSVKMNKDGIYEVIKHETKHNHPLIRAEWSHFHRSERKITDEKGKSIKRTISSRRKAAEPHHYMAYDSDYPLITEIVEPISATMVDTDDDLETLEQDAENANDEIADQDATMTDSTTKVELDDELGIVEWNEGIASDNGDSEDMSGSLLGMTGATIDEMYEMYCGHARANGFSVRKATTRLSTTGIELAKLFVCSCAGLKKSKTETMSTGKSRKEKNVGFTRTNCKALLSVKMNKEGIYEVVRHEMEHNHQLIEWSHFHHSERKVTDEKGKSIKQMISSGMKAAKSYHYMAYEAGGQEDVGHTLRDHMQMIEPRDAQTFIDMILDEREQDHEFVNKIKLDSEARLANIFWRDSLMKEDYTVYGDVVVFDTTYRTNKYNLICAPFFGINNHGKNVMFGCAFISDKKTETFEWLFKAFRKSMGGKYPISIFTDQDLAVANGIEKIFPETRHRLCPWHLQRNAIARFENSESETSFKDVFNKCLYECVDENDFEITWKRMITTYGLHDNLWFTRLHGLKEKWCTTLNKKFFSAGIRSSQQSESTNYSIEFKARKDTTLTDFYKIFKETVKNWRSEEHKDEFNCIRSKRESSFQMAGMIKHASEVYTLGLFRDFEQEFTKCVGVSSSLVEAVDSRMVYDVESIGDGPSSRVIFDETIKLIKCNCMKFEECGMLCYHCLRILHINSVQNIPDAYILKRWTKFARSQVWEKFNPEMSEKENADSDSITWRNDMMRKYYNLVLLSAENEAARRYLEESLNSTMTLIGTKQEETSAQSASSKTIFEERERESEIRK